MKFIVRKVDFEIQIKHPNYDSMTTFATIPPVIRFTSTPQKGSTETEEISTDLISYEFTESLDSVNAPFSLSIVPSVDSKGRSWLERINIRDLVYIYEFGELRYVGYVETVSYQSSITSDGKPMRTINVSGGNIGKLLSTFSLVLNMAYFHTSKTSETAYIQLMSKLSSQLEKGGRVAPVFKIIYDDFMSLIQELGDIGYKQGIKAILDEYLDIESELSDELTVLYPVSLSLYNVGVNNIWGIWKNLLFPPLNELFTRWNPSTKKLSLVYRESPFDADKWKDLKDYDIPAIGIVSININHSDSQLFSFYMCTLPGAGISENLAILMANPKSDNYVIDKKMWSIVGYKPMIVELKYFDRSQVESFSGAGALIKQISEKLKTWYEHNDTFYSGNITIMTPDKNKMIGDNPRIGEKINFLGGSFYIEKSTHKWEYGQSMTTNLYLTRGAVYNKSGVWQSPIVDIGRKIQSISLEGA